MSLEEGSTTSWEDKISPKNEVTKRVLSENMGF